MRPGCDHGLKCWSKAVGERTFHRKDNLLQHFYNVHKADKQCYATYDVNSYVRTLSPTEEQLKCHFCDYTSTTWQERVDHIVKHFMTQRRQNKIRQDEIRQDKTFRKTMPMEISDFSNGQYPRSGGRVSNNTDQSGVPTQCTNCLTQSTRDYPLCEACESNLELYGVVRSLSFPPLLHSQPFRDNSST